MKPLRVCIRLQKGFEMRQKLLYVWNHLEELILVPSFMLSTALIFFQVIMRYVFRNSLTWSEELVRYVYIWQTWIGVSYAVQNGSHLRITMLKDRLPAKAQQILELFVTIVWVGFAIFIAYQGMSAMKTIATFGQRSSALNIPMQFCYLSIPAGMIMMSIRLIEKTIRGFIRKKNDSEGGAAE